MAVSTTGDSSQSSQELFDPHTVHQLSRHEDSDFSFEGFPTLKRVQKLSSSVQTFLSDRHHPLSVGVMSSVSSLVSGARLRMRSLQLRLKVAEAHLVDEDLVFWDDSCLSYLQWWSDVSYLQAGGRSSSGFSSTEPLPVHQRFGLQLGCFSGRRPSLRLVVSDML